MANTSSRTLRLLSLLQTRRHWAGPELADRLGVSARTLRRDVDRLREIGYPVDARRGVEGGYRLSAGAALPPLVLDDEEAVALAVGLLQAPQSPIAGAAESSARALAKVIQVMPKPLRRRVDAMRAMTEPAAWEGQGERFEPEVLTTAAQACRDAEAIAFDYAAADGTPSRRSVEPHRIVSLGRRWYLVAYDNDRHDWRSFRLDRMSEARASGRRFAPRRLPAEDATAFVREGLRRLRGTQRVEAQVEAPARDVRRRIGRWAEVVESDDGRCMVTMDAEWLDWAAMALGSLEAPFRVIGPPYFADYVRRWGERFVGAAGQAAPSGATG